jgi:hypothetical protein
VQGRRSTTTQVSARPDRERGEKQLGNQREGVISGHHVVVGILIVGFLTAHPRGKRGSEAMKEVDVKWWLWWWWWGGGVLTQLEMSVEGVSLGTTQHPPVASIGARFTTPATLPYPYSTMLGASHTPESSLSIVAV